MAPLQTATDVKSLTADLTLQKSAATWLPQKHPIPLCVGNMGKVKNDSTSIHSAGDQMKF